MESKDQGTVFTEDVLVASQEGQLVGGCREYPISDQEGSKIGLVRQTGQGAFRKRVQSVGVIDQMMSSKLKVLDADGNTILQLIRAANAPKSNVGVHGPGGDEIGLIMLDNVIGKINFHLMAGEAKVGAINGENWRAWSWVIRNDKGREVGRITKDFEGIAPKTFDPDSHYVVRFTKPVEDPLRTLVVAAAAGIDTVLKPRSRAFH